MYSEIINKNRNKNIFTDKEKFLKETLFSGINLIPDEVFSEESMSNKNIMFFLNCIIDSLSSISMLGCRNVSFSLIGKINNIIEYYDGIVGLYDKPKMSKNKIDYIISAIKNNNIIDVEYKKKFLPLLANNDIELIENLKLIKSSLIENEYLENTADKLKSMLSDNQSLWFDEIYEFTMEYFALLIDFVGISVFEIKRLIRDAYRDFFENHNENVFMDLIDKFTNDYLEDKEYTLFVEMDKDFDGYLISSLKNSQNDNYLIYSRSGFERALGELNIRNKKILDNIIKAYVEDKQDNHYFISKKINTKDIWHAIREFRQKTIQPFIGTMLYAGINVSPINEYIVVEGNEEKKFINTHKYFDDIFKPLSQDRIDYSDVFKRYIIKTSCNDINKIIDEAVQLLPYYKKSDSILIKFTNTWFALETLFRNASDSIISALSECASCLVADRMISGYIYVTAVQIKKLYKYKIEKLSNNFVENIFLNYENSLDQELCSYLRWKYIKIKKFADNYENVYENRLLESKDILDNAYRLRNKQFHGAKDSKLENMSGILYDIVNDTIKFYIDYLDVYKKCNPDTKSLFNIIKNTKKIKNVLIKNETDYCKKISMLYDSVRKI